MTLDSQKTKAYLKDMGVRLAGDEILIAGQETKAVDCLDLAHQLWDKAYLEVDVWQSAEATGGPTRYVNEADGRESSSTVD